MQNGNDNDKRPEGDLGMTDLVPQSTTAMAAAARERADIQSGMVVAQNFPRKEAECFAKVIESCKRPSFAGTAKYNFPRGGGRVKGPSVGFAREAGRIWGHMRWGLTIVDSTDEQVTIEGYAYDLQTNVRVAAQDSFAKLIFRKAKGSFPGGWVKPDERDLRELVNRRGAICLRNAILQLLPSDLIEDAMREVEKTLVKAEEGEIKQDRAGVVRSLVYSCRQWGITQDDLERWAGNSADVWAPEQIVEMRGMLQAIKDGQATRQEFFGAPAQPETEPSKADLEGAKGQLEALRDQIEREGQEKAAQREAAQEQAEPEPAKGPAPQEEKSAPGPAESPKPPMKEFDPTTDREVGEPAPEPERPARAAQEDAALTLHACPRCGKGAVAPEGASTAFCDQCQQVFMIEEVPF